MVRDIASVAVGTVVFLASLFGVLLLFSAQCFAASDPAASTTRPTATVAPAQVGAGSSTPAITKDDGTTRTATPVSTATSVATATPPPPTATQQPPTPVPAPTQAAAPAQSATSFTGNWRVVDTVTEGTGAGQTFTFDITLAQVGNVLSGGNGGIVMNGTVQGSTAAVSFTQPGLGISGSFSWTMGAGGNASGTYTSSAPNSGTSQLIRR